MKKKVLLSSVATIALCLCLIAGSTFALFTDTTEFNIAVTSGDVEIKSTAEVVRHWSAQGPVDAHNDKYLKDENGNYYEHVDSGDTFTNGGKAEVNAEGTLEINRITPGDKVEIRINTQNLGNVAFRYRYTIKVDVDNGLAAGMVLTTHIGEEYEAVKSFTSEWFPVVEAGDTTKDLSKVISLELPVYAGNEYQSEHKGGYDENGEPYTKDDLKQVTYTILVEAVQGNAVTTGNETFVTLYPTQSAVELAVDNGGEINLNTEYFKSPDGFVVKDEPITFANGTVYGDYHQGMFAVLTNNSSTDASGIHKADITIAGDGKIQTSDTADSYGIMLFEGKDHKITLEKGSKIIASGRMSACIKVIFTNCDLYLDSIDSFVYDNGAHALQVIGNGHLTIHVADATTKAALELLIANQDFAYLDSNSTITVVVD